tara:strand:- start:21751 stop:22014 length:264 start_codon:yes stop_codon:yes gene_type:complete
MTTDAVIGFRNLINSNPEIEAKVRGFVTADEGLDLDRVAKLAEQHGFSFSEHDVMEVFANDNDELSDFELEMVAAGNQIGPGANSSL